MEPNVCKFSASHLCDASCLSECRLYQAAKPSVEWPGQFSNLSVETSPSDGTFPLLPIPPFSGSIPSETP